MLFSNFVVLGDARNGVKANSMPTLAERLGSFMRYSWKLVCSRRLNILA